MGLTDKLRKYARRLSRPVVKQWLSDMLVDSSVHDVQGAKSSLALRGFGGNAANGDRYVKEARQAIEIRVTFSGGLQQTVTRL